MAKFKYKDGQVHEYLDPKEVEWLKNHPDFEEVQEVKEVKPAKKKE